MISNIHSLATSTEMAFDGRFGLKRFDLFGINDSDTISNQPYWSMMAMLTYAYVNFEYIKKSVENFSEDYFELSNRSMDDISLKDGETKLNDMVSTFIGIIDSLKHQ